MNKTEKGHNLNINMYSLDEILGLFDLTTNITIEDIKRSKKRVLMLHPDKSRLSAEYFLFYKKAFEIVVRLYENNNKQNQEMTTENTEYKPLSNDYNKSTVKKVKSVIGEMNEKDFRQNFNKLFEENMVTKHDTTRNEWFSKEESIFKTNEQVSSKNMGQVFDNFKQQNAEIIKYRGVQNMHYNGGSRLYDNDEDEDDTYVCSDPFSKLKFDDLRKVHKDQTIFSVSERDFQKVPQYSSVDHYSRERSKQTLTPLEKQEAEQLLAMQDKQFRERIIQKEHVSNMKSMEYAEKNKAVMSNFLRLQGTT
jgi:hypothetical protein